MEDSMVDAKVKKHAKMVEEEDLDRINKLPEPILLHILSFLSMAESARTSVISRQWRYLWLFFLDFGLVPKDSDQPLDVQALKVWYFGWVNQVLRCHRDHVEEGEVLNKLRLQFPLRLDKRCFDQIDEWLSYAFARRVQTLELDFLIYSNRRSYISKIYRFPRRMVSETNDLSFLRSLSLSGVNLSRENIDSFLAKCRFLEYLKVCAAPKLDGIDVGSSTPSLKHLEIIHCKGLQYAIVRDTSLVSLTVSSVENLVLENNLNLVSVRVFSWYIDHGPILKTLSSCLSRLQTLTLYLNYESDVQVPQLSELKKLTLIAGPLEKDTLTRVAALLGLSPKLEKLVFDFLRMKRNVGVTPIWSCLKNRKKVPKVALEHVKDVEVRGYYGYVVEDMFFSYIFRRLIVAPIERIIFDPRTSRCDYSLPRNSPGALESMLQNSDEERAKQLKRVVRSSAEFIVL